ncbi:hypothetical protein [Pelagicoccus albus]|uniref:Uncharacterized protein n=1 Tax=Pelagicoccus albus TaxID=415222 RepID=A0A7X1B758_9BACT|nr:hypothetical protein [Pelagicoccus albus]MBC2606654.1 hypothetical protein [Pelagicoccus albus]
MRDTILRFGLRWVALGAVIISIAGVRAQEAPVWSFEIADSEKAFFEGEAFHKKDDGWLLTCRMRVKSKRMIAPVSKVEFEGYDEAEEVVWEKSYTVRRKDFDTAYNGGDELFMRVFMRNVPKEVVAVEMSYLKEDEESE